MEKTTTEALTTDQKVEQLADIFSKSTSAVKKDRAVEIAELIEISAKRRVEDTDRALKLLVRKEKSALDLSPDNTYTIMKVKDFNEEEFIETFVDLQLQVREATIKANAAKAAYNKLFGQTYTLTVLEG